MVRDVKMLVFEMCNNCQYASCPFALYI